MSSACKLFIQGWIMVLQNWMKVGTLMNIAWWWESVLYRDGDHEFMIEIKYVKIYDVAALIATKIATKSLRMP